ncbi:Helix-turn-helix domain-containing protein [Actinosynnema pretiosum]|uniref:helix-turn-helix domain-containing protein n=1 Tax=Actinosynnema pretiosum TaxID=42197 RepID=UPI0020A370EE|nr:helix-turn-helix transcriptional regulator [Actinosynnema pretiosum]MCP2098291.1 Helix-turn-helix domain-containing protein [Actinosynnema pretiosum]
MGGKELGDFLRARRTGLRPAEVGLPEGRGRRVAGLRREEVARLACVSTDYYTRVEQGRRRASGPVLDVLARVLRMDDDARAYLFALAGPRPARGGDRREAHPWLRRLLEDLAGTPAVVLGRRSDVLAWNGPAAALFTDFGRFPVRERNFVRLVFLDPELRAQYADWPHWARQGVAQLRMEAVRDPADPELAALVAELSARDADFRRWWGAQHVAARQSGTKVIRHPLVGELALDWAALTCAADPDQQLITWTAEPGSPAHERLRAVVGRPPL